jgi:hypothetical protein
MVSNRFAVRQLRCGYRLVYKAQGRSLAEEALAKISNRFAVKSDALLGCPRSRLRP